MKVIPTQYECEICGSRYHEEQDALDCETRKAPNYTIGLIYGDAADTSTHHHHNLTFCVAEYRVDRHWNNSGSWACRDNGHGDSLGTEWCGGSGFFTLGELDAVKDFTHPTFIRMLAYLKSVNVTPLIWDGEKEVPYVEDPN